MTAAVLHLSVEIVHFGACCVCGVPIAGPMSVYNEAHLRKAGFYCINGHQQHYQGETEAQRERRLREGVERELKFRTEAMERAQRSAAAYRGKLTEVKNRIQNGVCPCCKRSFQNLRRHMESKHPGWEGSEL